MREIKFDVILWDKVDPASIEHYTLQEAIGEDFIDFKDGAMIPQDDSIIIREFTGLKDKQGKEIYEGDICRFRAWLPKPIVWRDGRYWLGNSIVIVSEVECDGMEIIGNIYENPEITGDYKVGRN